MRVSVEHLIAVNMIKWCLYFPTSIILWWLSSASRTRPTWSPAVMSRPNCRPWIKRESHLVVGGTPKLDRQVLCYADADLYRVCYRIIEFPRFYNFKSICFGNSKN